MLSRTESTAGRNDVSPEQITIVETTLADLSPPALEALAADFYDRLLGADPSLAAMFSGDEAGQRRKFAEELATIVRSIRRYSEFAAEGRDLGRRHVAYGVRPCHFRLAGEALLGALAGAVGSSWTPATEEAWRLAYHLTAETMMAAGPTVQLP